MLEQTEIGPRIRAEPVEEINTLRVEGTRTHSSGMVVQPGKTAPLAAAGQSLDIVARFKLPAVGSQQKWRCGVRVLASTSQGHGDNGADDTYVEIGLTNEATLPSPPAPKLSRFMPNTDFPGGDNGGSCTGRQSLFSCLPSCLKKSLKKLVQAARSNFTSPKQCQASCDASDACQVWTWVRSGPNDTPRCCFKACHAPGCGEAVCCSGPHASTSCDSGVKDPRSYRPHSGPGGCPYCSHEGARLRVYADTYRAGGTIGQGSIHGGDAFLSLDSIADGNVDLRVLVDRSIITSFVNNGSAAVTTRAYTDGEEAHVFAGGEAACEVQGLQAWEMEEVFPPRNGGFRFPHGG